MAEGETDPGKSRSLITKEALTGFLAIAVGGYNLLTSFEILPLAWQFDIPQLIGNVLLIAAGLFLWITAFKLWRIKYHTRRIF